MPVDTVNPRSPPWTCPPLRPDAPRSICFCSPSRSVEPWARSLWTPVWSLGNPPGPPRVTSTDDNSVSSQDHGDDTPSTSSRVGVQSAEQVVHGEEVEQDRGEADHVDPGGPQSAPSRGRPGVQIGRVDHPGDEGPHLLGVPTPEPSPCLVRPDGTRDDPEGPDREG